MREIEELYKNYPNLRGLSFIDLVIMQNQLRKHQEDKEMLNAVLQLISLLSKQQNERQAKQNDR